MARVWRAWDPSLQRYVALKEPLFDPRYSSEVHGEISRRFVREAQVGMRLSGHPGIVSVYGADVYDGRPAVVMELVEGATLGEILRNGPLDQATALDALDQILDAVGYAHSMGVVHRDLKPDNIFVDKSGRVKVADFGVAGVNEASYAKATLVSVVLGTPGYMSPEQAMGGPADGRSDLFSIGVIAYEMLTGRNPFGVGEGVDSTQLLYRIVHEPVAPFPPEVGALLPNGLEAAIMAALSKRPENRPCDAATFKAMLHSSAQDMRAATAPMASLGPGGTVIMPVKTAADGRSSQPGSPARWVPVIASAALCVALIAGAVMATPSTRGGLAGSATTAGTSDSTSASSPESGLSYNESAGSESSSANESASASQSQASPSAASAPSASESDSGAPADVAADAPESPQQEPPQPEVATPEPSESLEPDATVYYGGPYVDEYAPAGEFWGVWIESFSNMDMAYACAADANAMGLPAAVYEIPDANGTYYVVSAGEFATRSEADSVVALAQSLGYYNAYTSTATYL